MTRIALVGAQGSADLRTDGPYLLAAFDAIGIEAEIVCWGEGKPWARFDAALIRDTWDYVFDRDAFVDWAVEVATSTRLANDPAVLRWNTDKRYLRDLQAAGVVTVPTVWVEPGDPTPVVDWDEFVVKPSVSAGARLAARYRRDEDPDDHIRRINATGAAAMLQPYVPSVDREGESGTYVFGGEVSHAIRKGPVLQLGQPPADDFSAAARQSVEAAIVDPKLAAFARRVLDAAPAVLYARVDTAPDAGGEPMLLELEVTEPFLFLEHVPAAADRFARAVDRWLQLSESP